MSQSGTQQTPERPEIISPDEKDTTIAQQKSLVDLLMTVTGKEVADKVLETIKIYAEKQAIAHIVSTGILALVIVAALTCATFLAYNSKFDTGIGTLMGMLVGFLVGRKSAE
jgi:hypothetical protein